MLSVSEDGVSPVHLLHNIWVYAVLLRGHKETKFNVKRYFLNFKILTYCVCVCLCVLP